MSAQEKQDSVDCLLAWDWLYDEYDNGMCCRAVCVVSFFPLCDHIVSVFSLIRIRSGVFTEGCLFSLSWMMDIENVFH